MRLLFDENLSPKLPRLLAAQFPGSLHIRECGLKGATDEIIWEFARTNQLTIVSKDADFYQRCILFGAPPKFIWLRVGNCSRDDLVNLLMTHEADIQLLDADPAEAILVMS